MNLEELLGLPSRGRNPLAFGFDYDLDPDNADYRERLRQAVKYEPPMPLDPYGPSSISGTGYHENTALEDFRSSKDRLYTTEPYSAHGPRGTSFGKALMVGGGTGAAIGLLLWYLAAQRRKRLEQRPELMPDMEEPD